MSEVCGTFDARSSGDQLTFDGEEFTAYDEAILKNSTANYGVRATYDDGKPPLDIEVWEYKPYSRDAASFVEVYPLDGNDRDGPIVVEAEHFDGSDHTIARLARYAMQLKRTV